MADPSAPPPALPGSFRLWAWFLLLALLAFTFICEIMLGSVKLSASEVFSALFGGDVETRTRVLVMDYRLPRALTALLAGAALSVGGLQMQTLFRNPLADPYVLGISAGASLGVAFVMLGTGVGLGLADLGLMGHAGVVLAASLGAGAIFALVWFVSRRMRNYAAILVLGLMLGYLVSSIVSVLIHFSIPEQVQEFFMWGSGTFSKVTWSQLPVFAPAIGVGLLVAMYAAKPLNALLLGENYARSLGLNVSRARQVVMASAALLSGTVTAYCGPIGFVGIAVPHLARGIFRTTNHVALIPATALLGSSAALIFDLAAQLPGQQYSLPLSATTALLGAPVVIWVILRRRPEGSA